MRRVVQGFHGNGQRTKQPRGNRLAAQRLNEILGAAQYIEKVSAHQDKSNQSLGTAIRIATQVTDQLIAGATSASEASSQLQEVIRQLRQVVGGNE